MRSAYQQIPQQYAKLKELVLDINDFLKEEENYAQFDPNIRAAILDTQNTTDIPFYIKKLPQVELIKNVRQSIQIIASDFQNEDYTKFVQMIFHLQNFWTVIESYLLAENTMCLSPEFNSKMLSLINFLVQCNQVFRDELNNISIKPQKILKSPQTQHANIDTRKWHDYQEKVNVLLQILPNENKLKPYIKNLERLIAFIIKLKEKGVLKSNLITTVLDFIESFNNVTQASIKEILQEYAILSENEINEILNHVNHFWESFLPICDEIEIDLGLTMGYFTQRLNPIFNFCNLLHVEFNQDYTDSCYPFTQKRLTRIRHAIEQTNSLLTEQNQRKQKLNEFNNLIKDFIHGKNFNLEKIVELHQFIELLNCESSLKNDFHHLIDAEIESFSKQFSPDQMESLQLDQLLNKYKLHEASLEDAQLLLSKLEHPKFAEKGQNLYLEMSNEYDELIKVFPTTLEKIEKGQLKNNDIKHLFVMINIFSVLKADLVEKSELVKSAVKNQIKNIEKLQELLDQFETSKLSEQNFYQLLSYIDFLDCDLELKKKYKKQITDLDHKRKNSSFLRLVSDFGLGLFAEVTVPFSEIRILVQNKITALQAITPENINSSLSKSNNKTVTNDLSIDFLEVINFGNKIQWINLQERVEFELNENEKRVETLQSIESYQEQRYQELKKSLVSYKEPIKRFDAIGERRQEESSSRKKYLTDFVKGSISKSTFFMSSIYSTAKNIFSKFKSFFFHKDPIENLDNLEIVRKETTPNTSLDSHKKIEVSPYKELNLIEENILWFFEKMVDPVYHPKLKEALTKHQTLELTGNMPYFYMQSAEIINIFILFRKVLLSYSHWDMLQLSLAVSNLNAETKVVFRSILQDSTLVKSSLYFQQIIKPTLSNSYQLIANLKSEDNFDASLPQVFHTIHHTLELIAQNKKLDLKPFIEFLKRLGDNLNKTNKSLNEDLQKIYCSINRLTQFVEKVLNNQKNFLVEVLFNLVDLSHQLRQLSTSITGLLIKDDFPYLKELGDIMKNLQDILVLFHNNISQFESAGLHPDIIKSLKDCVEGAEKVVRQLSPIRFQQERILLEIGEIKSTLYKCGSDRILQNELTNIFLLLTNESDQKFIDQKTLDSIETRLHEIKLQNKESYSYGCFGFFSRYNPFVKSQDRYQNSCTNKQRIKMV